MLLTRAISVGMVLWAWSYQAQAGLPEDPTTSTGEGAPLAVSCLGNPETAKDYGIFLHGIDTPSESAVFLDMKGELQKLAERLNVLIVLPRAPFRCEAPGWQDKICWNWQGRPEVVLKTRQRILDSASACGGVAAQGRAPAFMIGHSNGGYLVNRLHELCALPPAAKLLSFGSAGGGDLSQSSPLHPNCGSLRLMVGKGDPTYPKALSYYERLKAQNALVTFAPYPGGHDVPYVMLGELLVNSESSAP